MGLPDGLGQGLGQAGGAGEDLPGEGGHQVVGDPRRQGVDGHDPAGVLLAASPLEDGVDHGAPAALLFHRTEEDVLLPGPDGPLHIALVEEGEVEGAGLIHHLHLDQLQPRPDAGAAGVLGGHGPDAHPGAQGGLADGVLLPPVLIVPGVVLQQVGRPRQPQLGQLFGPLLPHARQGAHRRVQGDVQVLPSPLYSLSYSTTAGPGVKEDAPLSAGPGRV